MTTSKNLILNLMREDDIAHDPWGTAMAWGFAVCEVLYAAGEEVPRTLDYLPSPYVALSTERPEEFPDCVVWDALHDASAWVSGTTISVEDVQYAGLIIGRFLDWCKLAGRDY